VTWRGDNFPTRTGRRTPGAERAAESGLVLPWDGVEERESPEDSGSRRTEGGRVEWSTDLTETAEDALPLALVRAVCTRCFIELPVSGVCGFC
jgi:hypothetical protein